LSRSSLTVLVAAALLTACAGNPAKPRVESRGPIASAAAQPLKDLSLVREAPLPVLEDALAAPYRAPDDNACAGIGAEIAALDAVLGLDFDAPDYAASQTPKLSEELAVSAVNDLVGLPYRGVVRRVTGAHERDRKRQRAVLAGFVRRAYLKGIGSSLGCQPPASPAQP
jgi:hypothetical protein